MIHRLITAITLSVTTTFGALTTGGGAPQAGTTTLAVSELRDSESIHKASVPSAEDLMLREQLRTKRAGSVKFWEAVAWCETHHKWDDGGYFAGGLGIAQSTWRGYGGRQFAPTPAKATKTEQIIVANRISFLGFQTKNQFRSLEDKQNNKPFFRPPTRTPSWGRGCVNWKTRKPHRVAYTEEGQTLDRR